MNRNMRRGWLLAAFIVIIVAAGLMICFRPRSRLNVVLVTLDTTRADRLGTYGYAHAQTPVLDALARNGVQFQSAYCSVPLTLPSHASMFTGLYPPEHGLHVNGRGRLPGSVPALAEILANAGYETAAFVASFILDAKFGLDRGFRTYDDDYSGILSQPKEDEESPEYQYKNVRSGDAIMDAALAWLEPRSSRSFFCWIHFYDAHFPYRMRKETFGDLFADRPYDAGLAFADLQLGRLRSFLEERRLDKRTLIVVVGDHGEALGEHGEEEHGFQIYDSTMKVPLIFAGPRFVRPAHRVTAPVSIVDLMPTVLDCLSVPCPKPISGRSLKPALGGMDIDERPCYLESDLPFADLRCAPLRGLVSERWKYIRTTRPELYDLAHDARETENLLDARPEKAQELKLLLDEFAAGMSGREATDVQLSASERRMLRSLGYTAGVKAPTEVKELETLPDIKDVLPLDANIREASALYDAGSFAEAIATLREVLAKAPFHLQARLALGKALRSRNMLAESVEIFRALVEDQPDRSDIHYLLAHGLEQQGRLPEAVRHYRQATEISPKFPQYHFGLGLAYVKLGQPAAAISEFTEAIRCDRDFVDAYVQLGSILAQRGQTAAAIPHFEQALELKPDLVVANLNLASCLANERRFSEAYDHASRAVRSDAGSYEAHYTMGVVLMLQSRYRDAIAPLEEACRLRPDAVAARQLLKQAQTSLQGNTQ